MTTAAAAALAEESAGGWVEVAWVKEVLAVAAPGVARVKATKASARVAAARAANTRDTPRRLVACTCQACYPCTSQACTCSTTDRTSWPDLGEVEAVPAHSGTAVMTSEMQAAAPPSWRPRAAARESARPGCSFRRGANN